MTMITPSYLGETIEYSSLHACRSTLEDPTGDEALDYDRQVIRSVYLGDALDVNTLPVFCTDYQPGCGPFSPTILLGR